MKNLTRYEIYSEGWRHPLVFEVKPDGEWVKFSDVEKILTGAQQPQGEIIRLLDCMSSDERMEVFAEYCMHCGDKNPRCNCCNDE